MLKACFDMGHYSISVFLSRLGKKQKYKSRGDNGSNGECTLMKSFLSAFLIIIMTSGVALASTMHLGAVHADTDVTGIIDSDTTWTKANSPYSLTGPVAVNIGVTLTIEAGVQVYFNTYYLQVNGTLVAKGTDNEPVSFITGDGYPSEIRFMPSSQSWDEKTGAGSIIENGNIPSHSFRIIIEGASPKIASSDSRAGITINSGSPVFSNNRIKVSAFTIRGGAPLIINNKIYCRIIVEGGSPVILNNTITPDSYIGIEVTGGNPYISNNDINDFHIGISAAYGVIERNYIHGGPVGIEIGNGVVRNNTIAGATGISVQASSKPTITYNNFEIGNVEGIKNIFLAEGANQDVDAAHNWWGTTDEAIISQSIFDNKNDFTLGTVNFVPFLTEANPQAMPDPDASTPTAPSEQTPTHTPTPPPSSPSTSPSPSGGLLQTEFTTIIGAIIVVAVLGAGLGLLIYLIKRK